MQYDMIFNDSPWGLPTQFKLLPEVLQAQGYATHAIGKWDVGSYARDLWPTNRGFDTHFGLIGDAIQYVCCVTALQV